MSYDGMEDCIFSDWVSQVGAQEKGNERDVINQRHGLYVMAAFNEF